MPLTLSDGCHRPFSAGHHYRLPPPSSPPSSVDLLFSVVVLFKHRSRDNSIIRRFIGDNSVGMLKGGRREEERCVQQLAVVAGSKQQWLEIGGWRREEGGKVKLGNTILQNFLQSGN